MFLNHFDGKVLKKNLEYFLDDHHISFSGNNLVKKVLIMFNLITPKKREEFKKELDQMFVSIQKEMPEYASDEYDHEKANYLVFSHKKFGVIGGARIISIDANVLTSDLLKRLKFHSKQKIWEISRVFFHIPQDKIKDEHPVALDVIRRDFYLGMYDSLKTISIAQKIKMFVTALPAESHHEICSYGVWPFDKQANFSSPYKDDKQFVVGIMPMNAELYETFVQRRLSLETKVPII